MPETQRRQTTGKIHMKIYLQPLWLVIVARGPGINFALLVQPGFPGLPGEHVHVEGTENAGGSDLEILDVSWFHPQGLRATWNSRARSVVLPAYLCQGFRFFFVMAEKIYNTWRKRCNQGYCRRHSKTNKWKIVNSRHFVSTIAWVSQNQDREFNIFYLGINLWSETKWKDDFCLRLSYFYFPLLQENIVSPVLFDFPYAFMPLHNHHVFAYWTNIIFFLKNQCCSKMLKSTELFYTSQLFDI